MPLGGAVEYDRVDFIFAARAMVQTDPCAVVFFKTECWINFCTVG